MKIYQITPFIPTNYKSIKQTDVSHDNRHSAKSAALIAASLLSLAAMAKSEVDYDGIYKNKVEQTTHQISNNRPLIIEKKQKDFGERLTDEEKIHRFVILFSLLGFFAPALLGIFCGDTKERTTIEE